MVGQGGRGGRGSGGLGLASISYLGDREPALQMGIRGKQLTTKEERQGYETSRLGGGGILPLNPHPLCV